MSDRNADAALVLAHEAPENDPRLRDPRYRDAGILRWRWGLASGVGWFGLTVLGLIAVRSPAAQAGAWWAVALILAPSVYLSGVLAFFSHLRWCVVDALHRDAAYARLHQRSSGSLFQSQESTPPTVTESQQAAARLARWSGWPVGVALAVSAVVTLLVAWLTWPTTAAPASLPVAMILVIFGVVMVGLAARLASLDQERLPDSDHVAVSVHAAARMVLLVGLVATVGALGFETTLAGTSTTAWAMRVLGLLAGIIVLEHGLRGVLQVALPSNDPARRLPCASAIAGALALGSQRPALESLRERLGIDLGTHEGLLFLRRAALPLVVVIAVLGWLSSGLTVLTTDQRGIAESCGRPSAQTLGPGVHVHWPWPFGRIQVIENGVIHRAVVAMEEFGPRAVITPAEADSQAIDDRLWTVMHGQEILFLTANRRRLPIEGEASSRQVRAVELFSADVTVYYRIGLEHAEAQAYTYQTADHLRLVTMITRQLIQQRLVSLAAEELLSAERVTIGQDLHTHLQARLDHLGAGIDITTVTLEAIHPPISAGAAFDLVQTAEETVATMLARSRVQALLAITKARNDAHTALSDATAGAVETRTAANRDRIQFTTDVRSAAEGGTAYYVEQWLAAWSRGVRGRQLTILDPRLPVASPGIGLAPVLQVP